LGNLNPNKDLATSSDAVIRTNMEQKNDLQNKAHMSMKEQMLIFNTNSGQKNQNVQSKMSQNFQNKIQDKGFLDFDDLL
jgi:uncharacterized protein YijF (DUF1287 family)